jgi:hypothetical protein
LEVQDQLLITGFVKSVSTAIVAIAETKKINKQNLTAAGRGEFSPL